MQPAESDRSENRSDKDAPTAKASEAAYHDTETLPVSGSLGFTIIVLLEQTLYEQGCTEHASLEHVSDQPLVLALLSLLRLAQSACLRSAQ